jgi:hypothetical protein
MDGRDGFEQFTFPTKQFQSFPHINTSARLRPNPIQERDAMAKKKNETVVVATKQEPTTEGRTSYFMGLLPPDVRPELNSSGDPGKNLMFYVISECANRCEHLAESMDMLNNLLGFDTDLLTAKNSKLQATCMEIFRAHTAVTHAETCLNDAFDRIAEVNEEKAVRDAS